MTSLLSSSLNRSKYDSNGRKIVSKKSPAKRTNEAKRYPVASLERLDREISELDSTILANKELAASLADKRNRLLESKGEKILHSTYPSNESFTVQDLIDTETELEEANGLLQYRKALRERLRNRMNTMKQAADVTWRAYKGRGHSRDLALALAKIAALEREIDDLHDVELTMMQREQLRVRREAKLTATTQIENDELRAQVNDLEEKLNRERKLVADQAVQIQQAKTRNEVLEKELEEAHRTIVEETTASNLAKSEVSDLSRKLRVSQAEVHAVGTKLAEKTALAEHFKESLDVTNNAIDSELKLSETLLTRSRLTNALVAQARARSPLIGRTRSEFVDELIARERYLRERAEILEKADALDALNSRSPTSYIRSLRSLSPSKSSDLLASDLTLSDASLIRAKANAMAAAAEERLKVEEELLRSRLKDASL